MFTRDELRDAHALLERFCDERVPLHVRDRLVLQFRVEGQAIVLFEQRPYHADPSSWVTSDLAKFRWNRTRGTWSLLWRDRNARWRPYDRVEPSARLAVLLDEVDRDPAHLFWG